MRENMTDAHRAMANTFAQADPHSMGVMNRLFEIYPAFAKKIFHNNKFMQNVVLSGYNPMNILDYPVCGRCETLAAGDGEIIKNGKRVKVCRCFAEGCGATTTNPVTLKEWLLDELKKKAPPDFAWALEIESDKVAETFMRKALKDYGIAEARVTGEMNNALGIHLPDGRVKEVERKPRVNFQGKAITDEEMIEFKKEIRRKLENDQQK